MQDADMVPEISTTIGRYESLIYSRCRDLERSGKTLEEWTNRDLARIFEWYSCIRLMEKYQQPFYVYCDVDPTFKEKNQMSTVDTGIDACNMIDTIVQCKLRANTLSFPECSTFLASQVAYDDNNDMGFIKWPKLILTRNTECTLTSHLRNRIGIFTDIAYPRHELIQYCQDVLADPPVIPNTIVPFKRRDYQNECINMIRDNDANMVICLPTGTGKNMVIIFSMQPEKKYLILVPRIILMDQLVAEIRRYRSRSFPASTIQTIGDNNSSEFDPEKNITICVYNSVSKIVEHAHLFDRIFVDEAHHVAIPEIYASEESSAPSGESENANTSFIDTIVSLRQYNNNVYLSATIDELDGFMYYKKDIRDMIEAGYLCDYTIHVPVFSADPTDRNICEYLIDNHSRIIVYCHTRKEGKRIADLLNTLRPKCAEYIDCNTNKTVRQSILNRYKNGDISFLVNVRVLVEGFDAPITQGVCFMHMPSSETAAIQIIGRALRKHPLKTYANVILPCSTKEDGKNVNKFLSMISINDTHIMKSFKAKNLGGYISLDMIKNNNITVDNDQNAVFLYDMIFNSLGIIRNTIYIWMQKCDILKKYIDIHNSKPSMHDNKSLTKWLALQISNYKHKINSMNDPIIYDIWTQLRNDIKYGEFIMTIEELWTRNLHYCMDYIDKYHKRPSQRDSDPIIRYMGLWLCRQQKYYKSNKFKNVIYYAPYKSFITDDKYAEFFLTQEEIWKINLDKCVKFVDTYNRRPVVESDDIVEKKLGTWITNNQKNYRRKTGLMCQQDIYDIYHAFITDEKYLQLFISNEDLWKSQLNDYTTYLDINGINPKKSDPDPSVVKIANWYQRQKENYHKKFRIMKNPEIYNIWLNLRNHHIYGQFIT